MFARKTPLVALISEPRIACAFVSMLLLSGCGQNNAANAPAGATVNAPAETSAVTPGVDSPSVSKTSHGRDEVWVDEKGQKWFGKVPMDAFLDEPYEVASNQTPIGGAPATVIAANTNTTGTPDGVATTNAAEPPMSEDSPATAETLEGATGEGDDTWTSLISLVALEEEVKSIRNFMNENVKSVGTFNSSMLMIPPKAAALGALAGVAMEYPEAVSWKDDAKYIRNLAKKMNSDTLQRGAKDQKRIMGLFENIEDTLNRSKPAGLEEPPESDSFAEVSEMRLLMMRMGDAEKKMKTEAGTEGAMGAKKDMVAHEASMLAVMAKIVALPGYGYEDDAKFTDYAKTVIQAAQDARSAAQAGDFATYESALTKISTTCSNCHSDYKND